MILIYKKIVRILPLTMMDDVLGMARCGFPSVSLNNYINTNIELKKLKFHTPDKEGRTKCHVMHIGKQSDNCPQLEVHGARMQKVSEDTYLGDLISSDGKNMKNIKKRVGKGLGIVNDIMNILENVTLGEKYFQTAVILRESLFLNSILTNSEIWYNLTKAEIKELDDLAKHLLKRVMGTKVSVPSEGIMLELGVMNIEKKDASTIYIIFYLKVKRACCENSLSHNGNTQQNLGIGQNK